MTKTINKGTEIDSQPMERREQRPEPALLLLAQMDNDNEVASGAHSDTVLEVPPAGSAKEGYADDDDDYDDDEDNDESGGWHGIGDEYYP